MKLLYAEDEKSLSEAVVDILEYYNFSVDAVYDGQDALDYAEVGDYDGIILDIMMPKMSGLEVLSTLREQGNTTPVLLLTAKAEIEDRITGLDMGADDYLPKPFAMGELIARVRAMLRRKDNFSPSLLELGNTSLDRNSFTLSTGVSEDSKVVLAKHEFLMMESLMLNKGSFLSTDQLLENVWGLESDAEAGNVWVYISYLRKKLSGIGSNVEIVAKRNVGYRLEERND